MPEGITPLSDILDRSKVEMRVARDTEYIHVSDLIGKCIRRIALMEKLNRPAPAQAMSITDAITWGQGDVIADVIKRRAASGAPSQIWGYWRCLCKQTMTPTPCLLSEVEAGKTCAHCRGPVNIYEEVPIVHEEYRIVGRPDLLALMPDSKALFATELKSMAHDAWKEIVRPVPDHVIQIVFYWWLLREAGYRITNRVSVVYVTKGWQFGFKAAYKEFTLNAEAEVHRLDIYINEAKAIKAARDGGDLPPRICVNDGAPQARKCDVCRECFGGLNAHPPVTVSVAQALGGSAPRVRR